MSEINNKPCEELDLIDYILKLASWWKALLAGLLVGGIIGFVATVIQPPLYESETTIFVQESSGQLSILKDLPIQIGGSASGTAGYMKSVLMSESMAKRVIRELGLDKNKDFNFDSEKDLYKLADRLCKAVSVKDEKDGLITVSVMTRNPELSAKIANAYVDILGHIVVTASKRKADFIAKRIDETSSDLKKAEDDLLKFQQKNDVTQVEEQANVVIDQYTSIDSKVLTAESELSSLNSNLESAGKLEDLVDIEVRKRSLESSLDVLKKKRDELKSLVDGLPEVAMKYVRLKRNITLLSQTFELLSQQYQLARISQHGEDADYQIIDRAEPNSLKAAPKIKVTAVVGGFVGFVLALSFMAFYTALRDKKRAAAA